MNLLEQITDYTPSPPTRRHPSGRPRPGEVDRIRLHRHRPGRLSARPGQKAARYASADDGGRRSGRSLGAGERVVTWKALPSPMPSWSRSSAWTIRIARPATSPPRSFRSSWRSAKPMAAAAKICWSPSSPPTTSPCASAGRYARRIAQRGNDLKGTLGAHDPRRFGCRAAPASTAKRSSIPSPSPPIWPPAPSNMSTKAAPAIPKTSSAGFSPRAMPSSPCAWPSPAFTVRAARSMASTATSAPSATASTPNTAFDDLGTGLRHPRHRLQAAWRLPPYPSSHRRRASHPAARARSTRPPSRASSLKTYGYATRPIFRVDPNPPARDVAGLSIRVSTAVALKQGSAWPHNFSAWDDPEVRRLRNLIDVQVDEEIEARYPELNGCRLQFTLANGDSARSLPAQYERRARIPHDRRRNAPRNSPC